MQDEAKARVRSEVQGLTLEQLRERATRDAGKNHCAEAETRSALTELVVQCVPSFMFRATAVLIRGGPISLVEVRIACAPASNTCGPM